MMPIIFRKFIYTTQNSIQASLVYTIHLYTNLNAANSKENE